MIGTHPDRRGETRPADDKAPFQLAFKIMTDPYVGKLAFSGLQRLFEIRFYVLNATKGKRTHWPDFADACQSQIELDEVYASIAAAVGLRDTARILALSRSRSSWNHDFRSQSFR